MCLGVGSEKVCAFVILYDVFGFFVSFTRYPFWERVQREKMSPFDI